MQILKFLLEVLNFIFLTLFFIFQFSKFFILNLILLHLISIFLSSTTKRLLLQIDP